MAFYRRTESCRASGVPIAVHYRTPLHRLSAYRRFPRARPRLERAEALSREVLSLPMHADLDEKTQDRVIDTVRKALAVNSLKLGWQYIVNARVGKTFAFTERIRANFAFEAYNLLNNQYTTAVNNIAFVATAGILRPVAGLGEPIASSAYPYGSTARRAQLSVRFDF